MAPVFLADRASQTGWRTLGGLKGHAGKLDETNVTVGLGEEWASHSPFGPEGKVTRFEPGKVTIKDSRGAVVDELSNPCSSFAGHTLETPWTESQLAYFAGIALWTYFNMPFLLASPGVASERLEDWQENGETWQRLKVTFPSNIATHSTVQTLYVDADGLLKRHDYDVEIAGNTSGAHYIGGYTDVQGLKFPTERRIYALVPNNDLCSRVLISIFSLTAFCSKSADLSSCSLETMFVAGSMQWQSHGMEARPCRQH